MCIVLNDILHIPPENYPDWTICLNNANAEGIYSFSQDRARLLEHISWKRAANAATGFRNIDTKYCLQFIRLDRENKKDQWLFLGAFEKKGVLSFADGHQVYDLSPLALFSQFSDRLIVVYKKKQGPKQAKLHIKEIESIKVVSILEKEYIKASYPFPGYQSISLPFEELKQIIIGNVDNWRVLLENINCIYSILDESNGKIYIGSTYNKNGTWSRWSEYVYTNGHGNDCELKKLIDAQSDYAKNFRFSILEVFLNRDDSSHNILTREKHWKKVFQTVKLGNNGNW